MRGKDKKDNRHRESNRNRHRERNRDIIRFYAQIRRFGEKGDCWFWEVETLPLGTGDLLNIK